MTTKNSDSALFLFTVRFPFGDGEQFLCEEVVHLSRAFDHVFIQPMFGVRGCRQLPHNCTVCEPLWTNETGKSGKKTFYLKALINPLVWWRSMLESAYAASSGEWHPSVFAKIFMWAAYSAALERSVSVTTAINWKKGPRVAYSYWGHTPAMARKMLNHAGVPIAVRFHRTDLYLDANAKNGRWIGYAKYMPWFRDMTRQTDLLIFISEDGRRYFEKTWASSKSGQGKFHISRLGTKDIGSNPSKLADEFVVASCSRVAPIKQVEKIAAFVRELNKLLPVSLHWHHFGGRSVDLPEVSAEVNLLKSENIPVTFWGHVDHQSLIEFYTRNHVDLFVNFSSSEGVPVSIMEALSFDIPVVATNVGGTSEAVVSGISGLLIDAQEPDDPESLAARVVEALEIGGMLGRSEPKKYWHRRFDADRNYIELAQMLREIAA